MSLWYLYEVPPSSPPDLQELVQVDQSCIVCTVDDLEDRIIDGKWADSGSLLAPCSQPTDTQNDGPSRVLPSSSFRPLQAYPELWLALMPALVDEAEPSCLTNTPHATSAVQSDDASATPEPFHEHENDPCGGNTAEIALGRSEKEGMVGDMLPQEDSDDNRQLKRKQQKTRKNRESKGDKLITPSREWFDLTVNTNVYVTGLPEDVTLDELVRHFNRAGVVRIDRATGRPKVKIYQKGQGDALVCYAKQESVGMACEYLDGSVIRPGFVLHVEPAVFQQKPGTNYMPKAPQDISTTDRAATMRSFRCDDDDDAPLNAKKPRILTSQHPVDARLVWIPVFRETVLTETTQHGTLSHRARCRVLEDHVRAVCEQTAPVEHIKYYRNEHAFTVLFATPEEAQQVLLALQNGCTFPSATMYCCTDHYEKKKGKVNPALSGDVAP